MSFLFCAMILIELFAGWRRVRDAQPGSETNSRLCCPKVQLAQSTSVPVIRRMPNSRGHSRTKLRVLLETLENASVPSDRSLRQY